PSAQESPAGNLRMRLHHLLDFSDSILRRLLVIVDVEHLDSGINLGRAAEPCGALLEIRSVRIAVDCSHDAFAFQEFGEFHKCLLAALEIVHADSEEALASGRIARKGEHWNAPCVSPINGVV